MKRLVVPLLLALQISSAAPLVTDDPAIEEARSESERLAQEKRWSEVVEAGERLWTLRRQKLGSEHPDTALADGALGEAHMHLREWSLAEAHLTRALAVQEKALPPGDPEVRATLTRLGATLKEQQRHGEAEPLLRRARLLQLAEPEPDPEESAICARNVGWILRLQGRYDEAAEFFEQALTIRREIHGLPSELTRASLRELGELHELRGDVLGAAKCASERVTAVEQAFGPDSVEFATALADWSAIEERQGRVKEAMRAYQHVFAVLEKAPANAETLTAWRNLARLHEAGDRKADLRAALERELAVRTELHGADAPETIDVVARLARLCFDAEDFNAGAGHYARLSAWFEEHAPKQKTSRSEALRRHAIATFRAGRLVDAGPLFARSREWHEATFGPRHLTTLASWYDLWTFQAGSGQLVAALATAREVVARSERALGPTAPQTLSALDRLGQLHYELGQREEAAAIYGRVLAGTRKHFGADSAELFDALRRVAEWFEEGRDFASATPLRAERLRVAEARFGAESEEAAEAQEWTFNQSPEAPPLPPPARRKPGGPRGSRP